MKILFSIKKFSTLLYILGMLLTPAFFALAQEQPNPPPTRDGFGFGSVTEVATNAGYSPSNDLTLDQRISSLVATFLSLLGVIFMVLMIYGGYNWMTAAGDEAKIDKAKDTIRAAIIGLIIVIAAYGISVFVISRIWGAGSALPPQNNQP